MMADLQGSGSIEQDADLIVFLYRPEYYKEKEWNVEEKGPYEKPDVENAEVIVGKNRDGPTCVVGMKFKSETASFLNEENCGYVIEYVDQEEVNPSSDTMQNSWGDVDVPII
jgi:replicative DNA helicase